jgi:hypothetical protein
MPRKPPPERTRFKPGQSGNPLGAGAHNQELKKLRKLTQQDVADVGTFIVEGDVTALRKLAADKKENALKAVMASVWLRAYDKGDMNAMNAILDRIVGKVKEVKELQGINGSALIPSTPEARARTLDALLGALGKLTSGSTKA